MRFESILAAALPALVLAAPTPQDPDFTWDDTPEDSIVGGTAASAGEFPFIASLQVSGRHICGGTLINSNTIVTASHCSVRDVIGSPSNLRVRVGSLVSFTFSAPHSEKKEVAKLTHATEHHFRWYPRRRLRRLHPPQLQRRHLRLRRRHLEAVHSRLRRRQHCLRQPPRLRLRPCLGRHQHRRWMGCYP